MNCSPDSQWPMRVILTMVLTGSFCHQPLRAGTPLPTSQVTPTQSGAVRSTVPTGAASLGQTAVPMHALIKSGEAGQSRTTGLQVESGQGRIATTQGTIVPEVDYGVFTYGGSVYSSGTEDVVVRVLTTDTIRPLPRKQIENGLDPQTIASGIYLLSPGPARFIATPEQKGIAINLGTLPPGELIFAIKVPDHDGYFETGDATRNLDKLDHVRVRTFKSGPPEIWFEDAPGPKGTGRSDRDFDDLAISVSGGVDDGTMARVVDAVKAQQGESRRTSIAAVRQMYPKLARYLPAQ